MALTLAFVSAMAIGQAKKKPFVYSPFSKLQLDEQQVEKIAAIQREIRDQIKVLEQQERQRCEELLNDEQKAQLAKLETEAKEKASARSKAYRDKKKPVDEASTESAAGQ
jgi:hypothetical protein